LSAAIDSSVPPRRTPSSVDDRAVLQLDRGDLPGETAFVDGGGRLRVRAERVLVELGAGEPPPLDHHLGADPLVREHVVEDGVQARTGRVNAGLGADRGAHRDPAHRLDAARHHHVVLTADEAGGGEVDRLLAGTALPVDGHPRYRLRPAGREHGIAGDVEGLLADLADAAPDDVVDDLRVHPRPLGQGVEHMR
jgi:hypothetical protein